MYTNVGSGFFNRNF